MNSSPPLLISLLYGLIVMTPLVALHELGHAVAARRRVGGKVVVTVGHVGKLAEIGVGGIAMSIHAFAHPLKPAGSAEVDPARATVLDVILIALAGPAASLLGLAPTAWALSMVAPSGILHGLLWMATVGGFFAVLNIVPLTLEQRRGGRAFRTDGRVALDALRTGIAIRRGRANG